MQSKWKFAASSSQERRRKEFPLQGRCEDGADSAVALLEDTPSLFDENALLAKNSASSQTSLFRFADGGLTGLDASDSSAN